MRNLKKIIFLLLLFFSYNVYAMEDATLKNIKVNGITPVCVDYVCDVEIDSNSVTITYQTNSSNATVNIASGQTLILTGYTYTTTRVVTSGDKNHIITYTFNITKHVKSSDFSLNSLYVNDQEIELKKEQYVYQGVSIDYDVKDIIIKASPTSGKAKVDLKNTYEFPVDESSKSIDITVTAENGTSKNYRVLLTRSPKPDTTLNSLNIKDVLLKFNKNTFEYDVSVPYQINNLEIAAVASDTEATIKIDKKDLIVGDNVVLITVTNKKANSVYTLNVKRLDNQDVSLANLKSLTIKEYKKFDFEQNILEYNLVFNDIPNKLNIKATANNLDSKVIITGNDSLKDGSIINIKVLLNEIGISRTYKLNITKAHVSEKNTLLLIILIVIIFTTMILIFIFEKKIIFNKKNKKNIVKEKEEEIEII